MEFNTDKKKLVVLALGVISGRISSFSDEEYSLFGYDIYKIREIGVPVWAYIQAEAEGIILSLLLKEEALS